MIWYGVYLAGYLAAALLSLIFVRICVSVAPRLGFVDLPMHEAHKRHRNSTPVMGGAGMFLAWLITILGGLAVSTFGSSFFSSEIQGFFAGINSLWTPLAVILTGTTLVTVLGMADDRKAMKALPKFIGQAIVAGATAAAGMRISFLHQIPGANFIITTLWIMTLMNAMNFFDNMDGLAAGAALIAAFFMTFVAAYRCQYFVATLAAVTCGVATGFLCWNAPPARIFMGDGGSHFLGYILSILAIMTTFYLPSENPTPAPIFIPMLILSVPLLDAIVVVIIRLKLGVPIYKGDNRHISHRFVNLGLSRPRAVLLVLLLCLAVGIASMTLLWLPLAGALLILAQFAVIFALILIIQLSAKTE